MWVSKEKCRRAREYDVLSYLRIADPGELVRVSRNEYCLRSHDELEYLTASALVVERQGGPHGGYYLVEVRDIHFLLR